MDQLLTLREEALTPVATEFPLYGHMQPLAANDISRDTLALIYNLPMTVLPQYLRMGLYEMLQCIAGQCNGFIQDGTGSNISSWPTPIDPVSDYYFVGAYFDPRKANYRLPSAAVHVDTVLHEYAHYLDGIFPWAKDPLLPHIGSIDTTGFHDISYDLGSGSYCYTRRSNDPRDWVTKYGYNPGYGGCSAQQGVVFEEWAEAFSMYVAAGRDFRAAAQKSAMIARKYDWLKNNVFNGLEYDTDLPRGIESGCNDVYGTAAALPGYAHCNDDYIWDFTLPILRYRLTADASGDGSGTVSFSVGRIGYSYPAANNGSALLDPATFVTLTATADAGSMVTWTGECDATGGTAGISTCTITAMNSPRAVTAVFSNLDDADFTATPVSGAAPLLVSLTDQSINSPFFWAWDFGDGTAGMLQNEQHVFTTPGTYAISLSVTTANGTSTITRDAYINVTACANGKTRSGDGASFIENESAQSAYDAAADGDYVDLQALEIKESLTLWQDKNLTMRGGWDCSYSKNPMTTTLNGPLTITGGPVILENIIVR